MMFRMQIHLLLGLFQLSRTKSGGYVHDRGVVSVSASSVGGSRPKFGADLTTDENFNTANQPDQWIQYDFKGYSLRSYKYGPGGSHEGNTRTLFDR
jgi:hypothetical protein